MIDSGRYFVCGELFDFRVNVYRFYRFPSFGSDTAKIKKPLISAGLSSESTERSLLFRKSGEFAFDLIGKTPNLFVCGRIGAGQL